MPDVMMSPGLEEIVDVSGQGSVESVGPRVECTLMHPSGSIVGVVTSYVDIRNKSTYQGFDVTMELPHECLPEALGCREFESMVISLDGKAMTRRAILEGWIQRREVHPHRTGLAFMLSVRREDS